MPPALSHRRIKKERVDTKDKTEGQQSCDRLFLLLCGQMDQHVLRGWSHTTGALSQTESERESQYKGSGRGVIIRFCCFVVRWMSCW